MTDTLRYITLSEGGIDLTAGKLYVGNRHIFLDDAGDRREFAEFAHDNCPSGEIAFIIRCLKAPNGKCHGNYVDDKPDYDSNYIRCSAEHKAAAHRFTLSEVAEFLRFTHKQYHEHKQTSEFEVLLAPIRVVAEPPKPKPKPKRGNGGHEVGTILHCLVSGRREIVVGQHYRVASIDSDGDELIVPLDPDQHTRRQNFRFPSLASNPEFARATVFTVSN